MLPRCPHRRHCCMLLREFHTTRPYLRHVPDAFQLDPYTAKFETISSPRLSRLESNTRMAKKPSEGKQNEEKPHRKDGLSGTTDLSSLLQFRNRSARYPRAVEGAEGMGSRLARMQVNSNGSVPFSSAFVKRKAYLGASGSVAQSVSNDDRGDPPHLKSSLLSSGRTDGLFLPRVGGDPFLKDVLPPSPQSPIATLAHGLDSVLLNPGVQWLQDPQSQVYGFTTWLERIVPVRKFAFERLQTFVPSSRDEDLYAIAQREGRKYAGSTSSLSSLLGQIYYLISEDKLVNTSDLSNCFEVRPRSFTPGQRGAASVKLNYRNGVYLIDSVENVPGLSSKNILTWMGTLLEKFLTHPPREFLSLMRSVDNSAVVDKQPRREAYRYSKSDKLVLRSQLDCFDSRLPGTGVFDIKTRAVTSIRHDQLNFKESSGYQIRTLNGLNQSFEREYYDLIRSAFLKYSFQARIGNMDGVFVTYHNTKRIFGFQYIPLSEMDARLFGESAAGDAVFEKCMLLLEVVLERATRELPGQSIRLTAEKLEGKHDLKVFLEPADWDEELCGSRPVIQLDVSTKNYIGEGVTGGWSAVEKSSLPWTVHWTILKSTLDPSIIRTNLASARRRCLHRLFPPSGVELEEMENFWHRLQFNPVAPVEVPFMDKLFCQPPKAVRHLRQLARQGRADFNLSLRKQKGRPKFVRGIPNDAQMVAPLVALAHPLGSDLQAATTSSRGQQRKSSQSAKGGLWKMKRIRRANRAQP